MEKVLEARRDHLEESLHYLMIAVVAGWLESAGYSVRADHLGGPKARPAPVGDFVPDIEATRGEEVHLFEVETQSTLASPRSQYQLSRLAARAGARTYVVVPFDCIERARRLREVLEIDLHILPCYPFVGHVGASK
jgi:hypothetical protein